MRVKAKLSRVSYNDRGKPIIEFNRGFSYQAFASVDPGIMLVSDSRNHLQRFTKDEFYKFFEEIVKTPTLYVIEYGSHYDSDPWEIIGYANSKEEAQAFIDEKLHTSLYHCTEVKHISKVKE